MLCAGTNMLIKDYLQLNNVIILRDSSRENDDYNYASIIPTGLLNKLVTTKDFWKYGFDSFNCDKKIKQSDPTNDDLLK